jgi:hypothetical protein
MHQHRFVQTKDWSSLRKLQLVAHEQNQVHMPAPGCSRRRRFSTEQAKRVFFQWGTQPPHRWLGGLPSREGHSISREV